MRARGCCRPHRQCNRWHGRFRGNLSLRTRRLWLRIPCRTEHIRVRNRRLLGVLSGSSSAVPVRPWSDSDGSAAAATTSAISAAVHAVSGSPATPVCCTACRDSAVLASPNSRVFPRAATQRCVSECYTELRLCIASAAESAIRPATDLWTAWKSGV